MMSSPFSAMGSTLKPSTRIKVSEHYRCIARATLYSVGKNRGLFVVAALRQPSHLNARNVLH